VDGRAIGTYGPDLKESGVGRMERFSLEKTEGCQARQSGESAFSSNLVVMYPDCVKSQRQEKLREWEGPCLRFNVALRLTRALSSAFFRAISFAN
jgi:hypothetical protein